MSLWKQGALLSKSAGQPEIGRYHLHRISGPYCVVSKTVLRHHQHCCFFKVHEVQESFKDIQKKIQAWMRLYGLCAYLLSTLVRRCPLLRSMKILAGIGRSTWLMRPASGLQVLCAGQFAVQCFSASFYVFIVEYITL